MLELPVHMGAIMPQIGLRAFIYSIVFSLDVGQRLDIVGARSAVWIQSRGGVLKKGRLTNETLHRNI